MPPSIRTLSRSLLYGLAPGLPMLLAWNGAGVPALVAALTLGGALALAVEGGLVRPLRGLAKAVATGGPNADLTAWSGPDELGDLARALAARPVAATPTQTAHAPAGPPAGAAEAEALRALVEHLRTDAGAAVNALGTRMDRLQEEAEGLAGSSATITIGTVDATDAAAGAKENIGGVALATERLSGAIREISQQIAGVSAATRKASERGEQGRQRITTLSEEVARIGGVARLIADIAGQTNLLALNATIEAARAGEAGKGFAVVAGEVKSLAAQTSRATEEIARQVQQVAQATGQAVEIVRDMAGAVGDVDAAANAIAAAMTEQTAATAEIVQAVAVADAAAQTVTDRIRQVAEEAERASGRAIVVNDNAGDARAALAELRGLLDQVAQRAA